MELLTRYRRRLARDDGVTEVIAYVFMFAIGSMTLIFAMEILTDAQSRGNDLAAAKQADQLAQVSASLIEQASLVASNSPNASYSTTYSLPDMVGDNQLSVDVTKSLRSGGSSGDCDYAALLHVRSTDEQISTEIPLGNVATVKIEGECLAFSGEVDTSAEAARVRYERSAATGGTPTIFLEPASEVR